MTASIGSVPVEGRGRGRGQPLLALCPWKDEENLCRLCACVWARTAFSGRPARGGSTTVVHHERRREHRLCMVAWERATPS